MVAHIHYIFLE